MKEAHLDELRELREGRDDKVWSSGPGPEPGESEEVDGDGGHGRERAICSVVMYTSKYVSKLHVGVQV